MELLRTSRVLLRRWEHDDLPAFLEIYSRWEVMRWLGAPPRRAVSDLSEAGQRLARWHEREAGLDLPFGLWALAPVEGATPAGAPVGTVLLLPLHDAGGCTDQVEIGWHLHPDHQRRGLATEAAGALLQAAVEAGIHRVLALTDPDNTASQAVARRLGMTAPSMRIAVPPSESTVCRASWLPAAESTRPEPVDFPARASFSGRLCRGRASAATAAVAG